MTTITFTLNDGSTHDFNADSLTREQAFEAVRDGRMSFEQFDSWASEIRSEGYSDGADYQLESMSF